MNIEGVTVKPRRWPKDKMVNKVGTIWRALAVFGEEFVGATEVTKVYNNSVSPAEVESRDYVKAYLNYLVGCGRVERKPGTHLYRAVGEEEVSEMEEWSPT